jgi:hypothetical protein
MSTSRHPQWPLVRASIDKDDVTVIFTTGEPDELDGAMATCASAAEATALAQFINKQGCAPVVSMAAIDRRKLRRG